LGTRVVAPGDEGLYQPGVIQAVKTAENSDVPSRYSVRFDLTRKVREYSESDIIGPGFAGVTGIKLRPGQIVYVTYCNREMQGSVVCHRPNIDQVIVRLLNGGPEVQKKLEEVRLLESRKSARLIGHGNTDFSKLADFNIVHERKRLNSETSDMSSGTTSGRKRRGSETLSDSSDEGESYSPWSYSSEERAATPVMSECTAAMVLMNLSHAQQNSQQQQRMMQFSDHSTQNSPQDLSTTSLLSRSVPSNSYASAASPPILQDGSSSPMSSTSGASSLGSSWTPRGQLQPSPPGLHSSRATPTASSSSVQQAVANLTEAEALLQLSHCQESDEGIVSDQSSVADPEDPTAKRSKTEHVRIIYQCTWPKCGIKMDTCSDMERHVRSKHLKKQSIEEDLEGEEEFYYNEIEVPLNGEFITLCSAAAVGSGLCVSATLATPPAVFSTSAPPSSAAMLLPSTLADHMDMARPPHENPEYNFAHSRNFAALRPSPAHSQPPRRNPAHLASYPPPPPPPPQPSAFSSITAAVPIAIPVTNLAFARSAPPAHSNSHPQLAHHHHSGGKYIRLSPKPSLSASSAVNSAANAAAATASAIAAAAASNNLLTIQQHQQQQQHHHHHHVAAQVQHQQAQQNHPAPPCPPPGPPPAVNPHQVKSSPIRRPRGDAKKCRKVYGMDHRDLWCTQCKWKKACTRFGEAA